MKKLFIFFVLSSVFVMGRLIAFSQPIYSKRNIEIACFSDKAIDIALKNLPVNYHGNNLKGLVDEMLRREKLTKDEFETTKQFLERIETESGKNLLGDLNSNTIFSFEVREGNFRYNADDESMNFDMELSSFIPWISPCSENNSYYRLLVESTGNEIIPTRDEVVLDEDKESLPLKLSFKLILGKAKITKPSLRVLFVGKVKEINGKLYSVPSRSHRYINEYFLNFLLDEIWIYDITTGEIFLKHKVDFSKLREEMRELSKMDGGEFASIKSLYDNGKYDEAMTNLRKIRIAEPMDARGYFWSGKIHYKRGEIDEAVKFLKTTLFWNEKLIDAHIMLGNIYLEGRDCKMAQTYLSSAMKIDSKSQEVIDLQKKVQECNR